MFLLLGILAIVGVDKQIIELFGKDTRCWRSCSTCNVNSESKSSNILLRLVLWNAFLTNRCIATI